MSINFPTGATPNQIYSYNGLNWIYTGTYWKVYPQFTDILPLTGGTFDKNTETLTLSNVINDSISVSGFSDYFVTGGTYDSNTGIVTFLNTSGGSFNISGFTSGGGTFTGGTVSGATIFTNGLTATTISATTYQNLPTTTVTSYPSGSRQTFLQSKRTNINTVAAVIDVIRGYYITIDKDVTLTTMSANVSSAVAGNSIFGVYSLDATGYPDTLLFNSAVFDNSITGLQSTSISQTLTVGNYFVCYNSSSAATFRSFVSTDITNTAHVDGVMSGTSPYTGLAVANVYTGSLPATFPIGATNITASVPYLIFVVS